MLRWMVRAAKALIIKFEMRRLQSKEISKTTTDKRSVQIVEYRQQYGCITLPEARWIFQAVKRWSAYYILWLFMASTGIRQGEFCKLHLGSEEFKSSFKNDFWDMTYELDKPRNRVNKKGEQEEKTKWRTVRLNAFVRHEFLCHLKLHCTAVGPDGNLIYCTPWFYKDKKGRIITNKLVSFKGPETTDAYWWKVKARMRRAGFDVDRLEKSFTRKAGEEISSVKDTYVLRPHMWRHFATTLWYHQHNCDIISAMHWIGHDQPATTSVYLHAPDELASTPEELRSITFEQITGYDMADGDTENEIYA